MINVKVPPGIGDISWTYSKLSKLDDKFNVLISDDGPNRALQYVKLLPKINSVNYGRFNFHHVCDNTFPGDAPVNAVLDQGRKDWINLSPNRWLESGKRLEEYIPDLDTDFHYPILTSEYDRQFASNILHSAKYPFCIFTASYPGVAGWKGWHLKEWEEFIKLMKAYIPEFVFVLIGAQWDKSFCDDLSSMLPNIHHINLCAKTAIGTTLEVIRISKYFISFPSGLSILANVMRKPVTMFYPLHLEKLINTWPDKKSIENLEYKGCVFTTPKIIFEWLKNEYKIKSKI